MAKVTYKVVISGRVQGVSFRASMRDAAFGYGVSGWVRNRGDGTVEALVQGEAVRVMGLLEWARIGPPGAKVISLEKQLIEDYPAQTRFRVLAEDW